MVKKHVRQMQHRVAKRAHEQYFKAAKQLFDKNEELSHKLMSISLGFSRRYRAPVSKEVKRRFCRRCHVLLVPGRNCIVRLRKPNIIYHCRNCGHYNKIGYKK